MNNPALLSTLSAVATGLLLVAASTGWGRAVARWARAPVDRGLTLSWGLALLLALGGGATALGVATAPVLLGIELCGVAVLLLPPYPRRPLLDRPQMMLLGGAVVLLLVHLFAVAQFGANEPCDDFLGYQPLVQQLLQAGDLEAPFSLRRLAAYGGQTVLQAFAVPTGDPAAMLLVDAGLAPIFLLGLGWSWLARHGAPRPLPLAVTLLVGTGLVMRVNSASQATSLVCLFALVRTAVLLVEADQRVRLCVVYGLLAAAASSLRHFNLPFPALLLLAFLPAHVARRGWAAALTDGLLAGLSWLVFLAPWMAALLASSGTPLYPLIKGFHDPAFNYTSATGGWRAVVDMVLGTMMMGPVLVSVLLVPAAFCLPRDRAVRAVQCAALACAAIIMASFPGTIPFAMARYVQPVLATAFLATVLSALATGMVTSRLVRGAVVVVVAAGPVKVGYGDLDRLSSPPPPPYPAALHAERMAAYAEAQQLVPAGVPVFVYVSTPFAFDSSRNRILNADEPGPVSPPPGLPFFHGAEAVAAYLRGQGIRYVAFEDFDTAVTWCIAPAGLETLKEPLWQPWKRYLADMRANLAGLAGAHRVVYAAHGVTVIDLDATR